MSHARIAVLVFCTFSIFSILPNPAAAISYLLRAGVDQINSIGGDQTYDFYLNLHNLNFNSSGEAALELVSPNGSRFGESDPSQDAVFVRFDGIAPASLDSLLSGTWTIEETLTSGQFNRYQFDVPSLLNSPNFTAPPIITSPANGDIVDKVFDLIYTNPLPTSFGSRVIYADPALQGNFPTRQIVSPGHVTLSFADIPGVAGATISHYSVNNQVNIINVLNPTPMNFGANARFDELRPVAGMLSFNTSSPGISFTIIPEPSTAVLACASLTVLMLRRGPPAGVDPGRGRTWNEGRQETTRKGARPS